jgi:hypothetical protein
MNNTCFLMQILKCIGNLSDDVPGQVFAKIRKTDDLVEKLAARAQFKNNEIVLPRFGEVDEFNDIWVVKLPHNLNLFEDICSLDTIKSAPGPDYEGTRKASKTICFRNSRNG